MLGAIFGDIVGSVYEWNNIKTKEFPLLSEKAFFTDDSVMTLAVADALMTALEEDASEERTKEILVQTLQAYGRNYPDRGYGGMFSAWLRTSFPEPYHSFGNGSAMRVSSVGWLFDSLELVKQYARWSAEITHNHPEGIKGAESTAVAIYLARTGHSKEEIKDWIQKEYGYDLDQTLDEIRPTYHFNETCQGTVPQAIRAFYEAKNYEDAIRNAISLGGDSDTLACITGGIAEAYFGMPESLQEKALEKLDEDLVSFYHRFIMKVQQN